MSVLFEIGSLCIPTPFFMDYWHGYWIVVDRARDAHLNLSYITLHNLTYPRQVTIPVHDIGTYFIVISSAKWLGEEGNVAKYEDD